MSDLILIKSDARRIPLKDESVQCVVTSPPYWGLRDYGTARWEGGLEGCDHKQGRNGAGRADGVVDDRGQRNRDGTEALTRQTCPKCGAHRIDSQLGIEPTPEKYVANMVQVFREVNRVLKPNGVCWVNLGDSYASGGGNGAHEGGYRGGHDKSPKAVADNPLSQPNRQSIPGLKPKDLVGIPWRVAFALQADGWWLRQDIIWAKTNPMPESVRDRCTKSHEYLFLLTKSARYYWDQEAMKEPSNGDYKGSEFHTGKTGQHQLGRSSKNPRIHGNLPGRDDQGRACNGPGQEYRNRRSVWTIATQPYPGSHFATFPEALVEPCILAGSRPGDVVFDPFGGSGTVARVAIKHNRSAVHCDINYHELARDTRCAKIQRRMF